MCGKCEQQHKSPYVYGQGNCYQPPVCAQILCDVTPKKICRPVKVPCECQDEHKHEHKHGHKHCKKEEKKRLKKEHKEAKCHHKEDKHEHGGCAGSCKPCVSHFVRPAANSLPYPRHLNLCA